MLSLYTVRLSNGNHTQYCTVLKQFVYFVFLVYFITIKLAEKELVVILSTRDTVWSNSLAAIYNLVFSSDRCWLTIVLNCFAK